MAVDMFLKIGDVTGESTDKTHKGEIDVLAFSWGISNSGDTHQPTGAGDGKPNVQDLSLTTYVDKASPHLFLAVAKGERYDSALLTVRKAGANPVEYLKYKLTEVLVSSLSLGGSGGEDRLTQNLSLNFAKVQYDYTPQNTKGLVEKTISVTFDIAGNVAG